MTPHQQATAGGNQIIALERTYGSEWLVADGEPYLFDGATNRLHPINAGNAGYRAILGHRYGLLAEPLTKAVSSFLEAYTLTNGRPAVVRQFSHYEPHENALYLSRFDGSSYRLDGGEIKIVPNGQGALFMDDDGTPCEADIGNHGILFKELIDDLEYVHGETEGGLTSAAQRALLGTWMLAAGFADRFPTKPLLLVEGGQGSGKTTAIQRMSVVLSGKAFPMVVGENDQRDFPVLLKSSAPIAHLDNVDTPQDWLRDGVCSYATSGGWRRRKLFKDATPYDIRPQTWVAITSGNPSTFRRPDVADRCLIVRLQRRSKFSGGPIGDPVARVLGLRPKLLGEWIYLVNKIVGVLKDKDLPKDLPYRLADFAWFAYAVAKALGTNGKLVESALVGAQRERDALVLEDDAVATALMSWVTFPANPGREVLTTVLYQELADRSAEINAGQFPQNSKQFNVRLRAIAPAMEARGIYMTMSVVAGGKKSVVINVRG